MIPQEGLGSMARNCQKIGMEVVACAAPSIPLPLAKKTLKKPKKHAANVMHRTFKSSVPAWHYSFSNIPTHIACRWQEFLVYTNRQFVSGANAGLNMDSQFRINQGLVDLGVFPPEQNALVVAVACELPAKYNRPFCTFTCNEIGSVLIEQKLLDSISPATIWRMLKERVIRPWQYRSWLFPRDPKFLEKASVVLDLYHGLWQGQPLGPDDIVISADEKTSIQARERIHGLVPPDSDHPILVEHEYVRHGALALLAAMDTQTGSVIGRTEETTGIAPFMRLVDQVMRLKTYRKARRVFWITDNGSSHRPSTFPELLKSHYPNAISVHLPIHASWLNQIEAFFSIIQRRLLSIPHALGIGPLDHQIMSFIERYNTTAKPFNWRFTTIDLKAKLAAISI